MDDGWGSFGKSVWNMFTYYTSIYVSLRVAFPVNRSLAVIQRKQKSDNVFGQTYDHEGSK